MKKSYHKVRVKQAADATVIHAPGDGCALSEIRAIVADLARQVGFPETEIAKIEMAVDEACSNVVEHAYATDKEWSWDERRAEIRLDIRTDGQRLIIEINDHGQRFDFSIYRPTDMEACVQQMKDGGYGIHIMRRFMDEVQYNSNDQTGNILRLVKYLKKD